MSKPYAIFGAGLSARAACRLAESKGIEVVVIDEAGLGDQRTFDRSDLLRFDCFVFSPGFSLDHPWRVLAEEADVPCVGELAFAASFWTGAIIGVTGTNGKTTLTNLLNRALSLAGHDCVAAGNIGYPFSDAVLSEVNHPGAFVVLEISSFQAELPEGLELDALLWTNFAEDHLDRYDSMVSYFKAKARLFDCLKMDGICVVGPQVAAWIEGHNPGFDACSVAGEDVDVSPRLDARSVFHRFPYSEDFSLAVEFWWLSGYSSEVLIEVGNAFQLAPHRLDVVAERDGVKFWDDSKATNFHATLAALESVGRPVIWIGGGREKGGDVEAFAREVAGLVDVAVLYGEVAGRLAAALDGHLSLVHEYARFEDAVGAAAELATGWSEVNVLLSPGFASFDQFNSYGARGKSFIDTVLSLKRSRSWVRLAD
jgi:UDP-N-acetylmuramoylalanine--D-glutamate ligase